MSPVTVTAVGHTMLITIDRPEAMNAIDVHVHLGIGTAIEHANVDDSIRTVVLTGAGDRAFCAGADLKAVARGEQIVPDDPDTRAWGFAGFTRHASIKPTICAVNGVALGGGTEMVLAADLAVAAPHATFGLPEVSRGLMAAAGGLVRLPRRIPAKAAMELILTGRSVDAEEAADLGIINEVSDGRLVVDHALEIAERINRHAPLAVQASKRVAQGSLSGMTEDQAWERNATELAALRESDDYTEGARAFSERRPPHWRGR